METGWGFFAGSFHGYMDTRYFEIVNGVGLCFLYRAVLCCASLCGEVEVRLLLAMCD
jgi:hypothetical protein